MPAWSSGLRTDAPRHAICLPCCHPRPEIGDQPQNGQVRILFSFVGGPEHFEPMVPIARAAQVGGHAVAVACAPSLVAVVEAQGFPAFGIGSPGRGADVARRPLREVDIAREERDLRERFAGRAARLRATGLQVLASDWRPDVMVADEVDFGSMMAAEVLGIPYATVLVIAAGTLVRREVVRWHPRHSPGRAWPARGSGFHGAEPVLGAVPIPARSARPERPPARNHPPLPTG